MTDDLSKRYDEAVIRAMEAASDLLTSLPIDKYKNDYEASRKAILDQISGKIALKTTPLRAEELRKVDAEVRDLQIQKDQLEALYKRSLNLLDGFKAATYAKDTESWNRETTIKDVKTKDEDIKERRLKGLQLAGNLAL